MSCSEAVIPFTEHNVVTATTPSFKYIKAKLKPPLLPTQITKHKRRDLQKWVKKESIQHKCLKEHGFFLRAWADQGQVKVSCFTVYSDKQSS